MKNWNKGRFGFWFYTKNYMRNRDAVMARIMETQGSRKERERILHILETTPFIWMGDVQLVQVGRQHLIDLIKGENN